MVFRNPLAKLQAVLQGVGFFGLTEEDVWQVLVEVVNSGPAERTGAECLDEIAHLLWQRMSAERRPMSGQMPVALFDVAVDLGKATEVGLTEEQVWEVVLEVVSTTPPDKSAAERLDDLAAALSARIGRKE